MTVVAVIVFDRIENIKRWVNCWKQSHTDGAKLVVIHNYYGDDKLKTLFYDYCSKHSVIYIPRNGKGFDIGGLQDVFRGRLPGFPDWDNLLWCTDDVVPMTKDFIRPFTDALSINGVACMQISDEYKRHIRTTGFCIKKEVADKIQFPADPVTTKQHCYLFEHRGGLLTMTEQLTKMGVKFVQVAPLKQSPLYDQGYWQRNKNSRMRRAELDRQVEHEKTFNSMISIAIPTYDMGGQGARMLTQLLNTIRVQTVAYEYEVLISDSSTNKEIKDVCDRFDMLPIRYIVNKDRFGASENINNCIDNAKYDKVKIMCMDDLFSLKNSINLFAEGLLTHNWVISDHYFIDERNKIYNQRKTAYNHRQFDKNITGMPSVTAFKRSEIRFDESLKTVCDMKFYYDLFEQYGPPGVIHSYAVAQRFWNGSLSRNQESRHREEKEYLVKNKLIAV